MDSSGKQAPPGAPSVVPLSNEGGALAQFLSENPVSKTTPPAASAETDGVALGQFLRRARERRGLTLQQISDETKIPCRRLEALEQGDLATMPGEFYGRSEVRAYAELVRADPHVALARFDRAFEALALPVAPDAEPAEAPIRIAGKALTATGALAAAALVWFAVWGRSTPAPEGDVRAGSVTQTQKPGGPAVPASSVTQTQKPEGSAVPASSVTETQERGGPASSEPEGQARAAQVPVNASAGTSGHVPSAHTVPSATQAQSPFVEAGRSSPSPVDRAATKSTDSDDDSSLQSDSNGELIVTTEPPGGRVTVDGIGWGTTPVTIRNLPPGPKHVRVTKDGYGVEERVVQFAPNRSTITLQIPLRSAP